MTMAAKLAQSHFIQRCCIRSNLSHIWIRHPAHELHLHSVIVSIALSDKPRTTDALAKKGLEQSHGQPSEVGILAAPAFIPPATPI
jgi:hypothetical protein